MSESEFGSHISEIFGPRVLFATGAVDSGLETLLPAERALVAGAGPARLREFTVGRVLVRDLLGRIGMTDVPVLTDPNGAPQWPTGVVGSISHSRGMCLVVLARRSEILGIGVDLEHNEPLDSSLVETICTTRERGWLARCPRSSRGHFARLIFSAKECAYKCQYPLTGAQLDYCDLQVELHSQSQEFVATLPEDAGATLPRGASLRGKYHIFQDWVVTGIVLPAWLES